MSPCDPMMRDYLADVAILDAEGLAQLPVLADERDDRACRYVAALVGAGPRHYVDNADVEARGLVVDGRVLPLLLADGVPGNADVCSTSSHYLAYTIEEFGKRHPHIPGVVPRGLLLPLRLILEAGRIDRVVFVNNWLFATNPAHRLSSEQVAAVTDRLRTTYPDAAIVFRSLNPRIDPEGIERLCQSGYRLVRSRRVYVFDPRNGQYLEHKNTRRDRSLLARSAYRVVDDADVLARHAARLAALHRDLYLHKHSWLNPQLNEHFFALTLHERILTYRALVLDGQIDGFLAYYVENGIMTGSLVGYDRTRPPQTGLYRMIFALLMAEAAQRGLPLTLSGGAGRFKMLRGATPVEEFDAVYDRHLGPHRRLAWISLRYTSALWARVLRSTAPAASAQAPVLWDQVWGSAWKPHPANPWFHYQADALAAWAHAWAPALVGRSGAWVLKTDAFDEACGFDPLSELLGEARSVLMDVSPQILSRAVAAGGSARVACATDVRTLAFRDASFDLIYSPSTLDHFAYERQIEVALRQLRRVLRPGATLLMTLDNPTNPILRVRNLLFRVTGPIGGLIPFPMGRTLSRARLNAALRLAGLEVLKSDYVVHVPRILALWVGEWAARGERPRCISWLQGWFRRLDRMLSWIPTRRWTGHYVIVLARRSRVRPVI